MRPFVSARVICKSLITGWAWVWLIGSWSVTRKLCNGWSVPERETQGSRGRVFYWQVHISAAVRDVLQIKPDWTTKLVESSYPLRSASLVALVDDLRKAGLPDK